MCCSQQEKCSPPSAWTRASEALDKTDLTGSTTNASRASHVEHVTVKCAKGQNQPTVTKLSQ